MEIQVTSHPQPQLILFVFVFLTILLTMKYFICWLVVFHLEKAMATHSSTLAWKIPWTKEPGKLKSMGSLRAGHDWATSLSLFTFTHWRRKWHPTPALFPGKSHGPRSLVGYSPWGCKESDTTKRLHFHVSLSCIGEGDGSPLQRSCLENPRDRGAWWAAVSGLAQSRTRLKRLSSSSSSSMKVKAWIAMFIMNWIVNFTSFS